MGQKSGNFALKCVASAVTLKESAGGRDGAENGVDLVTFQTMGLQVD